MKRESSPPPASGAGFLDLTVEEFLGIQEHLLMEEIDLMRGTPIGKKLMTGAAPSLSRPAWRSSAAWGADDYISKPFRPRDLLARVSAVLRRANLAGPARENHTVTRGKLTLKLTSNQFQVGDHTDRLTPTESLLLYTPMQNAGTTTDGRTILQEVWGKDRGDTEILRTYIRRLRDRLNDNPPQIILTDHGEGYRFVSPL